MIYYNKNTRVLKAQAGTKTSITDHASDFMTNLMHGISTLGMSTVGDVISGVSPKAAAAVEKYSLGMIPYTHAEKRVANRSSTPNYKANRVSSVAGAMNGAAAGVLTGGVLKAMIPGIVNGTLMSKATKALGTETGLLSKAYKVNPFAEKLNNANKSYRIAGLDSYADFLESGVVRSKRTLPENATILDVMDARPTAFPSFQKGVADMRYLPEKGGVVYETNVPTFKRGELNPVTGKQIKGRHYAHRPIDMETGAVITDLPAKDVKVFDSKPHWRSGFQETGKNKNFKSEIDWGSWNKEIPTNSNLMREYNAIEQTTKKAGTWMKNPNGSKFEGSTEQFVQQKSENFKRFFDKSLITNDSGAPKIMYHGSPNKSIMSFLSPGQKGYVKSPTTTTGESGVYFSDLQSYADKYQNFTDIKNLNGRTYPTYLAPKTALIAGEEASINGLPPSFLWNHKAVPTDAVRAGTYMRKVYPEHGYEVAMQNPNLIKSAEGNNGMFNITDSNIYKAVAPVALTTGAYLKTKKRNGGILYK